MTILSTIVEAKRRELQSLKKPGRFSVRRGPRFSEALRGRDRPSLIAEIKRASPSEGEIRKDFDPVALARQYEAAGASAVSVLTDAEFFKGSLEDLRRVAAVTSLPVLRKDFILDEVQIYGALEAGASAVLLIAAILNFDELRRLREVAESLGMEALVEVHDARELAIALESGATIIGINNRDLSTFSVDLNTTLALLEKIPNGVTVISESGIRDRRDMARLRGKVDAGLVGTTIMRCPDVFLKIRELLGGRPLLKVCGIRDLATARACEEMGVDLLGFNFVEGTPRAVLPEVLREELMGQTFRAKTVGLFRDAPLEFVQQHASELDLDLVQLHGDESADYCARVGRPVIKSFLPGQTPFLDVIPLFDLPKGSTGVITPPVFKGAFGLAGGLTPDNVCTTVGESCPLFVDVARGVESDGRIDSAKVQHFLNQIQSC